MSVLNSYASGDDDRKSPSDIARTLDPPTEVLQALYRDQDPAPLNIHTVWFAGSIALGATFLVAVGLIVPRKGLSPFWGRMPDIFDGIVLPSLVPLCLAVLDVYAMARGFTS